MERARMSGLLHTSWRPTIGWICVLALAWHFLLFDLLLWAVAIVAPHRAVPASPTGTGELVTVLLALLGLGGLRTVEKIKGVSRDGPDKLAGARAREKAATEKAAREKERRTSGETAVSRKPQAERNLR